MFSNVGLAPWETKKRQMNPCANIQIRMRDRNPIKIKQNHTAIGIRNLGIHLPPNGSLNEQVIHLQNKAVRLAVGFQSAIFTAKELQKAYFTIAIPKLSYLLSVTHFNKKTLNKIQAKFIPVVLNVGRYPKNLPRAIIYARNIFGGVGMIHLYFLQGAQQIKVFVGLMKTQSELVVLFCINLDYFCMHIGSKTCSFSNPNPIKYVATDYSTNGITTLNDTITTGTG